MFERTAANALNRLALGFPVLTITGPRQSGKTTLAKAHFPNKPYVTLEDPEERTLAQADPRRFLARFTQGAILDEVQRCPDLFSYLQAVVDERGKMADFILTGSQQFGLMSGISQSLAGRVGLVQLLPLSHSELDKAGKLVANAETMMCKGGYPALYQRSLSPEDWFANYITTYIERDVRQLVGVRDLMVFQRFVKMCAARSGQLLNLSSLAADCGITHTTARQWLSVLEASYLVRLVQPYFENFGKRLVKTPKLYFLDVGLMAYLLGIRDAKTLQTHAARGALFETMIVIEVIKHYFNQGKEAPLYFWRDAQGHEIDLLIPAQQGSENGMLQAIEVKSGTTFAMDWLDGLKKWQKMPVASQGEQNLPWLVYGGAKSYALESAKVLGWRDMAGALDA